MPLLADHVGTDRVIVACADNDKPLGFVYAYMRGKGSSSYSIGRDHLYIAAVCVDPDNHKKGVGNALLSELVKSNSHRKICSHAFFINEAAKKLYKKNGFNELAILYSKEAFQETDKTKKVASIKPFEITSMAGGIKCPYCKQEGFDKGEFDEHLKYCAEYLKIKDTPLARPIMKSSTTDEVGKFYIVTKPSLDSTLLDIMFDTDIKGLQNQYLGGLQSGDIEGIFTDKYVAETVAKSLLDSVDPDAMEKEGAKKYRKLGPDELIQEGDEFLNAFGKWVPATNFGQKVLSENYRRPV